MKTGKHNENIYPETFYITLLGLDALLKRAGFKDCVLFKNHNDSYIMSPELFASGVCFNLFSDYGIGKRLEVLLVELFKNLKIDFEKNKDNIFYKEIVRLAEFTAPLVRDPDPIKEVEWTYNYAIENISKVDKISSERFKRLFPLFDNLSEIVDFGEDEIKDENEIEFCECGFCNEFRKYHYPRDEDINKIIMDVLTTLRI